MHLSWRQISSAWQKAGLNLQAVIPLDLVKNKIKNQAFLKDLDNKYHSLILLGNGGQKFWPEFKKAALKSPQPVDEYSIQTALRLTSSFGELEPEILYPSESSVPLGKLGELAGWAYPSPLGLAIHPQFGLWFGFRVLLAVKKIPTAGSEQKSPTDSSGQKSPHPCLGCEDKNCLQVCPVGDPSNLEPIALKACGEFRLEPGSPCQYRCPAREACPVGAKNSYCKEQIHFHGSHSYLSLVKYLDKNN